MLRLCPEIHTHTSHITDSVRFLRGVRPPASARTPYTRGTVAAVSRALSPLSLSGLSRRGRVWRVCVLSPVSRACRGVSRGFPGWMARRVRRERPHTQHTQRASSSRRRGLLVSDTPQGAAVKEHTHWALTILVPYPGRCACRLNVNSQAALRTIN